ncbi:MAG: undecaprenyl diphosphate synthase family protein [bacterium]|nr:undecaprenyl diphosphate synthase family protein [bacterium]
MQKLAKKKKDLSNIDEKTLSQSLDLGNIPPIELVIRTKGEIAHRTSGFMSWWIGYAELFFTKKMCPELMVKDLQEALQRFDKVYQHRNF